MDKNTLRELTYDVFGILQSAMKDREAAELTGEVVTKIQSRYDVTIRAADVIPPNEVL